MQREQQCVDITQTYICDQDLGQYIYHMGQRKIAWSCAWRTQHICSHHFLRRSLSCRKQLPSMNTDAMTSAVPYSSLEMSSEPHKKTYRKHYLPPVALPSLIVRYECTSDWRSDKAPNS